MARNKTPVGFAFTVAQLSSYYRVTIGNPRGIVDLVAVHYQAFNRAFDRAFDQAFDEAFDEAFAKAYV